MIQETMRKKSIQSGSNFASEKDMLETCESLYWFPQYLNEVCPFKSEYNFEWRRYLILKNSEVVRKAVHSKERFTFYLPKIVKSVFNVCRIFRQPPEVRYLAVDVLDRFLVEHFVKVKQTFEDNLDDLGTTWEAVVERMLKQSPLRILSSVQLAMKYSWSYNIVTATDIQKMLELLGHKERYPKRSILKSEARIYQHLNYNIPNKTPLAYLEMFFDDFQKNEFYNIKISLHHFFITCIHVLDVAIIFHRQIYENLTDNKQMPDTTPRKNSSIVSLKANFVVLSASVIFASSILEDPSTVLSEILLHTLCSIGECRQSDIKALGRELLNIILCV